MQALSRVAPAASASSSRRTFRTRANVVAKPVALSTYSGMRRASVVDSLGSSTGRVSLTAAISRSSKVASGVARRFTTTAMFEVRAVALFEGRGWILRAEAETLPSCEKRVSERLPDVLLLVCAALHREGHQGRHARAGGGPSPRPQLRGD